MHQVRELIHVWNHGLIRHARSYCFVLVEASLSTVVADPGEGTSHGDLRDPATGGKLRGRGAAVLHEQALTGEGYHSDMRSQLWN